MSGHNRWAKVKHVKAKQDKIKGKLFTKAIKELTICAKNGGGDPALNASLRVAIQKAKDVNMPQDTIKKAIQRATGELPGVSYEELTYEGYGPGGCAIIIDVLTDKKNKAVAEIRHILDRNGGKMAESGAVSYMFKKRACFTISKEATTEDNLMSIVLDAGAEDIKDAGDVFEITGEPSAFEAIKTALDGAKFETLSGEITKMPDTYVNLNKNDAEKMIKLEDALEEYDDVQDVYSNYDIDEATAAEMA